MVLYQCQRPRRLVMPLLVFSSVFAAGAPSATITRGEINSSCSVRNGEHAAISSGSGVRLFGGRHLTVLQMYTSSRFNPIAPMILLSNWPARPTNGSPCKSSSWPGPSPTKTSFALRLPVPKTTFVRPSCSTQFTHAFARASSSRQRSSLSGVMPSNIGAVVTDAECRGTVPCSALADFAFTTTGIATVVGAARSSLTRGTTSTPKDCSKRKRSNASRRVSVNSLNSLIFSQRNFALRLENLRISKFFSAPSSAPARLCVKNSRSTSYYFSSAGTSRTFLICAFDPPQYGNDSTTTTASHATQSASTIHGAMLRFREASSRS